MKGLELFLQTFDEANIPTNDIVLYMRCDGNLTDQTGNNTPTSPSPLYGNGIYTGNANESLEMVRLNNNHVIVPDNNLLSPEANPFTLNISVNGQNFAADSVGGFDLKFFISKRELSNNREWQLSTPGLTNNTPIAIVFTAFDNNLAGSKRYETLNRVLNNNVNYNITVTWNGTDAKIYLDGVEEAVTTTVSGTFTQMRNTVSDVWIGKNNLTGWPSDYGLTGNIDNVIMWNGTALTSAEVLSLYNLLSSGNNLL